MNLITNVIGFLLIIFFGIVGGLALWEKVPANVKKQLGLIVNGLKEKPTSKQIKKEEEKEVVDSPGVAQ